MSEALWPTVTEVSRELGIDGSYIRRLLRNGTINGRQKGNTWIIDPESLRRFTESRDSKRQGNSASATQQQTE